MTKLDKIVHACVFTLAALLVGAGVAHAQPVPAARGWSADRTCAHGARRRLGQLLQPDSRGPRRRPSHSTATASASTCRASPRTRTRIRSSARCSACRTLVFAGRSAARRRLRAVSRSSRFHAPVVSWSSGGCRTPARYADGHRARHQRAARAAEGARCVGRHDRRRARELGGQVRAVVVQDPAGHFVELVQPVNMPPAPAGSNCEYFRRQTAAHGRQSRALARALP